MLLAHGIEKKVGICDIECYHEMFDVGCYNPETGEWKEFEVSKWKNELYEFVTFYTSKPYDYLVTYNGIGYDQQVLQYVVDNYQKWYDLSPLEIAKKISEYSGRVIENSKYNIPPQYREDHFSIYPLDIFRIHHFDNEAKRTSLKWCEYMMNMEVEEMPVPFWKKDLTEEEIVEVRKYRRHDVRATEALLYITLGQVDKVVELNGGYSLPELKDYLGKNMLQDRFDVMKETGLKCLNWSDVKIGEEWNKLDYMVAEKITDPQSLFPKKMKSIYGQPFKNFFPRTLEFTTEHMRKTIEQIGNQIVRKPKKDDKKKQTYPIRLGNTVYTFAKGGIHSCEKNRKVIPQKGWILRDADVGSQYPNAIVKFEIFGPHLKITILQQYQGKIKKRIYYKKLGNDLKKQGKEEEARPYMSIQEMLKLCLNGGYFGKLGQPGSFLEYQEGLLKCCVGNEIEILMAIEMMEEAGFQVLSGNTDGFVTLFPADKEDLYNQVCTRWEEKVGNVDMGKLEYTDFAGLWQESINHYIAKKTDGKVKKKGRFSTEFPLYKDKSERIIPLALEAFFIEGKDPVEFITNHKNIFDFCIAVKASGQMYYEEQWEENGKTMTKTHKKLVVYYISKEGTVLWKRGVNHEGKPVNGQVNAPDKDFDRGQPLVTYFNKIIKHEDFSKYNVDYSYYILETLKRIDAIEKTKKADRYAESLKPQKQITLF